MNDRSDTVVLPEGLFVWTGTGWAVNKETEVRTDFNRDPMGAALDRWITGDYGERQFVRPPVGNLERQDDGEFWPAREEDDDSFPTRQFAARVVWENNIFTVELDENGIKDEYPDLLPLMPAMECDLELFHQNGVVLLDGTEIDKATAAKLLTEYPEKN